MKPWGQANSRPNSLQNSRQNLDTNWGPLSETTSVGRPCKRKTWLTTVNAVSLAEGNLGKGIKWAAFENRSTTVKTTVLPWEGGRAVTKSSEMWDQGLEGTGSGWSSPSGGRLEVLPMAQTEQANTKLWTSWAIRGHQNRCFTRNLVRLTPGWQATLEQCPHWITSDLNPSGTNNRFGGHSTGGVTPSKAVLTFDSTSHTSVETNRFSGKMHSGVDGRSERSKIRDKESGLMFLEPGRYERVKSKRPKKSAHRACLEFNLLAVLMYSRFLWSVQTIKGTPEPSNQWRHSSNANLTANNSLLPMS